MLKKEKTGRTGRDGRTDAMVFGRTFPIVDMIQNAIHSRENLDVIKKVDGADEQDGRTVLNITFQWWT